MKTIKVFFVALVVSLFVFGSAYAIPLAPANDELSLQQILDLSVDPNVLDADNPDGTELWFSVDGSSSAYEVSDLFRGHGGNLGIFSASTGAEHDLTNNFFDIAINNGTGSYELSIGGSLVDANFGETFGFYWHNTTADTYSYTAHAKNTDGYTADNVMALTYLVPEQTTVHYGLTYDGSGDKEDSTNYYMAYTMPNVSTGNDDWIIAFEDLIEANGDGDFNDQVFYIKDLEPVPEPATILLFGAGLLGLAAYGRKKGFRRS